MIKDQVACCIPSKSVKRELLLRTSWPFVNAKMEENMSIQTENDNQKIICEIMKMKLISDISSVTGKARRQ